MYYTLKTPLIMLCWFSGNWLAARPALDYRRSSHTGVTSNNGGGNHGSRRGSTSQHRKTAWGGGGGAGGGGQPCHSGSNSPRYNNPAVAATAAASTGLDTCLLQPPRRRSRGASLPGNMNLVQPDEIYRLRNFSMSGKKVVNRGDSLKTKSQHSINSTGSR